LQRAINQFQFRVDADLLPHINDCLRRLLLEGVIVRGLREIGDWLVRVATLLEERFRLRGIERCEGASGVVIFLALILEAARVDRVAAPERVC